MAVEDIFTIKEGKIIYFYKSVIKGLKSKETFEDRFIFLYKKAFLDYERLKRLQNDIEKIYQSKLDSGIDEQELSQYLNKEEFDYIRECIKEHDEFSATIKDIFKTNSSYVKTTVKEKADLYIRKIIPIYEEKGMLETLNEIIMKDSLPLLTLNSEYFDNLVTFALVDDRLRLKNHQILLRDIFSLSKILICYQMLLQNVNIDSTYPTIFGDDKEKVLLLSNEARYINKYKPGMLSSILAKQGLTREQISLNMDSYIKHYEKREQEKQEARRNQEIADLENEVYKCAIIVNRFVQSNFSDPEEYLTINRVDRKKFYKALKIIEVNKHPIYEDYTKKLEIADSQIDFDRILDGIKNGVEEKGEIRPFDLVDYYLITKLDPREAKRIANRKLPYEDYNKIYNFHKKYHDDKELTETTKPLLFKRLYKFCDHEATDDDKRTVLLLLGKQGIRLTETTFKIYLRRYCLGKITQEEIDKIKSLKTK